MRGEVKKSFCFFLIFLMFFLFAGNSVIFCQTSFSNSENNPAFNEENNSFQEILPGPGLLEKAANFLYTLYDYVRKAIIFSLEKTIFKDNPGLADFYGDAASFLASLTAVYLLLLLVASAKKIIGVLLLLGWVLFALTIVIRG